MNIQEITQLFNKDREDIAQAFLESGDPFAYLKSHSEVADKAVTEIFKVNRLPERISVAAIGGYGREQLFPYSDLDLLFLLPDDVLDSELLPVRSVINDLWSLGLTVGYSVRNLDECVQQAQVDITAQTAMLESRFLYGDKERFNQYEKRMGELLDLKTFFRAKFIEQEQRHLKYHDSSYTLEPNIKESPGGLRDLNILSWVLQAAGYGRTYNEVYSSGLITKKERDLLRTVTSGLYRLRIHLHLLSHRHEDRMVFEVQESLAKVMGFLPIPGRRASELLMQRFYVNAKTISQLNSIILQAIKEDITQENNLPGKIVDQNFIVRGDVLDVRSDKTFIENPHAILEAFLFSVNHRDVPKKSSKLYRGLLHAHSLMDESFANDPVNKETFLEIIQAKRGTWHALDEMNRWGVLGRLLPSFRKVIGQLQHDLFHVYTVDEHTLLAIKYLRQFTRSEHAHEFPLCSELMMSLKKNWRLVLALLYHDIGKGRGGDHSNIGAREIAQMAKDYGLSEEDSDYLEFLVQEHLTLSKIAQKQDISDPAVVHAFAEKVKTMDKLIGLYLITVCDIRATNPKLWNGWKAQLLESLFYATAKVLRGNTISRETLVNTRREEALSQGNFSEEEKIKVKHLWDSIDFAYFMRHSVKNIIWHAKVLLPHLNQPESFVATRTLNGMQHAHEVLVLTQDRPELFARIVSYLQKQNLSILEARIHTGKDNRVVDSFIVVDDGSYPDFTYVLKIIEKELALKLDQVEPLGPPIKGRLSRQSRLFPIVPQVTLRPDAGGHQFLLSVVATDRLGLLASIARVLVQFKLNLVTARIATLGERVEDVFLVEGRGLRDPLFCADVETAVLESLEL